MQHSVLFQNMEDFDNLIAMRPRILCPKQLYLLIFLLSIKIAKLIIMKKSCVAIIIKMTLLPEWANPQPRAGRRRMQQASHGRC